MKKVEVVAVVKRSMVDVKNRIVPVQTNGILGESKTTHQKREENLKNQMHRIPNYERARPSHQTGK